jgi:hypothetical protein
MAFVGLLLVGFEVFQLLIFLIEGVTRSHDLT